MYVHQEFLDFMTNTLTLIYRFFMRNWWLACFLVIPILNMVISLVKSLYSNHE